MLQSPADADEEKSSGKNNKMGPKSMPKGQEENSATGENATGRDNSTENTANVATAG